MSKNMYNLTGFELIEIWAILFADDCAIVSESEEELQEILRAFVEVCTLFGQEVSYKKTEVMVVQRAAPRVEMPIRALIMKVEVSLKNQELQLPPNQHLHTPLLKLSISERGNIT